MLADLTEGQIRRLLAVLDAGKGRNWRWLLDWMTDESRYYYTHGSLSDPEIVVQNFERDEGWESWTPEGEFER